LNRDRRRRIGVWFAWVALALGLPSVALSAFWGLGGTWLLDTIGGAFEEQGRARNPVVILVVWMAVLLKILASLVGVAVFDPPSRLSIRLIRLIGWTAGGVLFVYGFVLTAAGLLVQAGAISTSADADRHALRWHAYFWDPWFLLWGFCLLIAMRQSRPTVTNRRGAGSRV
jgi:hypothetical protein